MVQIGTISYKAEVTGADEAQGQAEGVDDSFTQMGEQSQATAAAVGGLGGAMGTTAGAVEDTTHATEQSDEQFTLLSSTLGLVTKGFKRLFGYLAGGAVLSALASAAGYVATALAGLTLSGVVGTVVGALGAFVGWLAAGSAAAIGVAVVIGILIGLFVVWILHITGVLDYIGELARELGNELPAYARDGILAIIGLFAGPLAVIGAFIVGFIEGGFDEAFAKARETIDIFLGAFGRTFNRIARIAGDGLQSVKDFFTDAYDWIVLKLTGIKNTANKVIDNFAAGWSNALDDVVTFFTDLRTDALAAIDEVLGAAEDLPGDVADFFVDLGSGFSGAFADTFNAVIPAQVGLDPVTLPSVTIDAGPLGSAQVGGDTIFGGVTFDMPRLQEGGLIGSTGIAEVHEGEVVGDPGALVEAAGMPATGGGGGDDIVNVEEVNIDLSGDFDPAAVGRRDLERLADRITKSIGDKTNRRTGVR